MAGIMPSRRASSGLNLASVAGYISSPAHTREIGIVLAHPQDSPARDRIKRASRTIFIEESVGLHAIHNPTVPGSHDGHSSPWPAASTSTITWLASGKNSNSSNGIRATNSQARPCQAGALLFPESDGELATTSGSLFDHGRLRVRSYSEPRA